MNDVKMWIGTPGEGDWKDVGEVQDFTASFEHEPEPLGLLDINKPVKPLFPEVTITTTVEPSSLDRMLEIIAKYGGRLSDEMERMYQSVMVIGTRAVAHKHPGPWDLRLRRYMNQEHARSAGATKRVEHARERKLYSERLRRDRRRQRKGRKPILRTGPKFQALFPRVRVDNVRQQDDLVGMRMIASEMLDTGQVMVYNPDLVNQFTEPKPIKFEEPKIQGYTPKTWIYDEPFFSNPSRITKVDSS